MTKNEIKKELERIERAIFIEHMADFLDWNAVRSLEKEKAKLKAMLNEKKEEKPQSEYNKQLEKQWAEQRQNHINALVAGILED